MVAPSVLLASDGLAMRLFFFDWCLVCAALGGPCIPSGRWLIQPSLLSSLVDDEVKRCIPKCKVYVYLAPMGGG